MSSDAAADSRVVISSYTIEAMISRLLPILILFFCVAPSVDAKTLFDVSHSLAESQHRGIFIATARVSPPAFDWAGHTVHFKEAWFEQSEKPEYFRLCLKAEVDGDIEGEHRISDEIKSYLEFRRFGDPQSFRGGRVMFLPKKKIPKLLLGRTYGEEVHYINVPQSDAHAVKIVAFTHGRNSEGAIAVRT